MTRFLRSGCTFSLLPLAGVLALACSTVPAAAGGGTGGAGGGGGTGTGTPPANVPVSNPNSPLPVSANLATATQTVAGLCLALIDASCGGQVACQKAASKAACLAQKSVQREIADCMASVGPALEQVKKGTVKIDQAKFTACYTAVGSTCITQSPIACQEFATGGRKLGDPCADNTECKPVGFCAKTGTTGDCMVGTCKAYAGAGESCENAQCQAGLKCKDGKVCAVPPKAGEACSFDLACDASQYCSDTKVCTVRAAAGGACTTGIECPVGALCVSGTCHSTAQLKALAGVAPGEGFANPSTKCSLDKETKAYVCTLKSATAYVGKGSPCEGSASGGSAGTATTGGGAAAPRATSDTGTSAQDTGSKDAGSADAGGDPIGPPPVTLKRMCKIGFLCDAATKVCVDPPALGAACGSSVCVDSQCSSECGPYLTCDLATKACALPPGAGKPCDKDCAAPFTCDPTAKVCAARKDAGAPCTVGDDCASDKCKSDVCAAQCAIP